MKFCIDCRHFLVPKLDSLEASAFSRCGRTGIVSVVTGETQYSYCDNQRASDYASAFSRCGPGAQFFEEIEPAADFPEREVSRG